MIEGKRGNASEPVGRNNERRVKISSGRAEADGVEDDAVQIAGDPERVCEWLGLPAAKTSTVIDFSFVAPHGTPGLLTVTFDTPEGAVTI